MIQQEKQRSKTGFSGGLCSSQASMSRPFPSPLSRASCNQVGRSLYGGRGTPKWTVLHYASHCSFSCAQLLIFEQDGEANGWNALTLKPKA